MDLRRKRLSPERYPNVVASNEDTRDILPSQTALKQSPISDLFGGVLHSSVRSHGAKESVTMEPFFSLKLDIQETSVWSVKDALDGLATKEALHGYTSSKTGEEVRVRAAVYIIN